MHDVLELNLGILQRRRLILNADNSAWNMTLKQAFRGLGQFDVRVRARDLQRPVPFIQLHVAHPGMLRLDRFLEQEPLVARGLCVALLVTLHR